MIYFLKFLVLFYKALWWYVNYFIEHPGRAFVGTFYALLAIAAIGWLVYASLKDSDGGIFFFTFKD